MNKRFPVLQPFFRRAFSLVEMMVAMAVFGLLTLSLVGVTNMAGNLWTTGEGQNQRRSSGRALLSHIARELQCAALPAGLPVREGAAAGADLQFVANLPQNAANNTVMPAEVLRPHAIFWQAPVARSNSRGEMACVGYFVAWDTTVAGQAKPQLCRFFVEPDDTANYLVYATESGAPVNWLSTLGTVAPVASFSGGRLTGLNGWFADNVIALWVRCLDARGEPITANAAGEALNGGYGFDSRQGYTDSENRMHAGPALPAAVEVALVTLDQKTALRLTAPLIPTVSGPAQFEQDLDSFIQGLPAVVKPGAQVFSTRVMLRNSRP